MHTLAEITARMAEIDGILTRNEEGIDVEALRTEIGELTAERTRIEAAAAEQRRNLLGQVRTAAGQSNLEPMIPNQSRDNQTVVFTRSSEEYRTAWLQRIRKKDLSEVEERAFSSLSTSAGAAIPTQTADMIIQKLKQIAPLLGEITLLHIAGSVKYAVEDTVDDAALHTENAEVTAASDSLKEITLGSYEINKLVQISKTVATMAIPAFEAWLTDMLARKIAEKINGYLVSGTGSSQPQGVGSAATWTDGTNQVTVAKASSLSTGNVQTLMSLLPGQFDMNGKFLMSKKTLWQDFAPLQDNSKTSIVKGEGKDGFNIYGYPVLLDENIPLHDAYLGDFRQGIVGNLPEDINIVSAFDIDHNAFKFLGAAIFDSKVAQPTAFVKLTKATA